MNECWADGCQKEARKEMALCDDCAREIGGRRIEGPTIDPIPDPEEEVDRLTQTGGELSILANDRRIRIAALEEEVERLTSFVSGQAAELAEAHGDARSAQGFARELQEEFARRSENQRAPDSGLETHKRFNEWVAKGFREAREREARSAQTPGLVGRWALWTEGVAGEDGPGEDLVHLGEIVHICDVPYAREAPPDTWLLVLFGDGELARIRAEEVSRVGTFEELRAHADELAEVAKGL